MMQASAAQVIYLQGSVKPKMLQDNSAEDCASAQLASHCCVLKAAVPYLKKVTKREDANLLAL
jgi:hypothetical protein